MISVSLPYTMPLDILLCHISSTHLSYYTIKEEPDMECGPWLKVFYLIHIRLSNMWYLGLSLMYCFCNIMLSMTFRIGCCSILCWVEPSLSVKGFWWMIVPDILLERCLCKILPCLHNLVYIFENVNCFACIKSLHRYSLASFIVKNLSFSKICDLKAACNLHCIDDIYLN